MQLLKRFCFAAGFEAMDKGGACEAGFPIKTLREVVAATIGDGCLQARLKGRGAGAWRRR